MQRLGGAFAAGRAARPEERRGAYSRALPRRCACSPNRSRSITTTLGGFLQMMGFDGVELSSTAGRPYSARWRYRSAPGARNRGDDRVGPRCSGVEHDDYIGAKQGTAHHHGMGQRDGRSDSQRPASGRTMATAWRAWSMAQREISMLAQIGRRGQDANRTAQCDAEFRGQFGHRSERGDPSVRCGCRIQFRRGLRGGLQRIPPRCTWPCRASRWLPCAIASGRRAPMARKR